jgi:arsenite methyltransferase
MRPRFIARQFSHPRGVLGRLIMRMMNRRNARLNAFAVQQLAIRPTDRVLEIGFGGGLALPFLLEHAAFTAGVDRSAEAVRRAEIQFAQLVAEGRAEFREGSVEALDYESASFTKVYTVNTIYFWTSLESGFKQISRVLSAHGKLVVGFYPKEAMERMDLPPDIFTLRSPAEVVAALGHADFQDIRLEQPAPTTIWRVATATR